MQDPYSKYLFRNQVREFYEKNKLDLSYEKNDWNEAFREIIFEDQQEMTAEQ